MFRLATLLLCAAASVGGEAFASRVVSVFYEVDGKEVLESYYGDDGYPRQAEVWHYLATPPNGVQDETVAIGPLEGKPLEAELKGEVTLRVKYSGELKLDSLRLVRDDPATQQWYLPPNEVERTAKLLGYDAPSINHPAPSAMTPLEEMLGFRWQFAAAGGGAIVLLLLGLMLWRRT